ncbi:UDP-N-acetylmuramoyl-L-alanine--D-glutamate ligase [Pararoseomonas indoligenes]|uniref:UDP-N-acetylmuramoylalanine--D-glutamate ligase n=1 Tax=Roseomonas indoligenes TaxID=2820811 RepID=A0A940MZX3_9PROT|nr:UDP-N-acetylmuramoyl-L-alanine--D-glutamate ligase [Pararoseomonas indoligenes]MBP0493531.1 UDP-N-acetylmuramoyl-L-alanine--D-glutamate ligase [Pararoseomonas indoligenes]
MTPFAGQRIAVLGLGRAGLPAARRLRDWGADVTAWDDGEAARAAAEAAGIAVGQPERFDLLMISPGIPHRGPKAHPLARRAAEIGAPVLCDVEFLYRAVRAVGSRARFVGITGTNGKSTTTALLDHLARAAGMVVATGGNLGPPALDMPVLADDGVYILEMSSYSAERLDRARFALGALLNLSPDHLDRHGDMAGYAAAKARVMLGNDLAVFGMDDAETRAVAAAHEGRVVPVSGHMPQPGGIWGDGALLRDGAGVIVDLSGALALPGPHNAQNAAAATALAFGLGIARAVAGRALLTYPGLPHRQERVGEVDGIAFLNDSKATNADSTAYALACHDRVVWIAGGVPKAGGIVPLASLFPRVAEALLIGQAAEEFAATLAEHGVPHRVVGTLDAAVAEGLEAARRTGSGAVLLSPACASFDQFRSFEARGDAFRDFVRNLANREAEAA